MYSSVANIRSEFRSLDIGTDTAITTLEVQDFIAEIDSLINSIVGLRYIVPIVEANSPNAFKLLRMISRKLVAMRVKDILAVKDAASVALNQDTRGDFSKSDLMKMLKEISAGLIKLDDAVALSTAQGLTSFNFENREKPVFKKNVDQW